MSLFPLGAFGCSHPTLLYTNTDVVFSPCVNEISLKHNKAVCTKPKQTNKQTKNQKKKTTQKTERAVSRLGIIFSYLFPICILG